MTGDYFLMKKGDNSISKDKKHHFSRPCSIPSENIAVKPMSYSVQLVEKKFTFSSSLPNISSCQSQSRESHLKDETVELLRLCHSDSEISTLNICDNLEISACFYDFEEKSSSSAHNRVVENNHFANDTENHNNDVDELNKESGTLTVSVNENDTSVRQKRKVRFADDEGFELSETREYDSDEEIVLSNVACAEKTVEVFYTPSWTKEFKNPCENYISFYSKVNAQSVLLETFDVKDTFCIASILVKNLGFEKNVHLRVTYDKWSTSVDVPAFFCESKFKSPYDKFTCNLSLPVDSACESIEFAIRYVCSNREFWDNNDGVNYKLTKLTASSSTFDRSSDGSSLVCPAEMRYDDHMYPNFDFYKDKYDKYSVWNHFSDDARYY